GRLALLEVQPGLDTNQTAPTTPDWNQFFAAAGLDPARFSSVAPKVVPPMAADTNLAWVGTWSADRSEPVRVEAAAWEGKPVFFDAAGILERRVAAPARAIAGYPLALIVFFGVSFLGSAWAAWRNLRLGRGDRSAAWRLAAATFLISFAAWIL